MRPRGGVIMLCVDIGIYDVGFGVICIRIVHRVETVLKPSQCLRRILGAFSLLVGMRLPPKHFYSSS